MAKAGSDDDDTSGTKPDPKLQEHLGLPDPPPRDDAKALPHDDRLDTETAHAPGPPPEGSRDG